MSTDGNGQGDMNFQSAFTDASVPPQGPPSTQPPAAAPAVPAAPEPTPTPIPEPIQAPSPVPIPGQPSPEPAPAPTVPQPAAPIQSEVATMAAQAGITVDGKTDAQIFQEITQGYAQMRPYAEWAQQIAPHYDEITDYLKEKQQPAAPAEPKEPEWTPEQYFQEKWQAPTWDAQFDVAINNNYVSRNSETGLWESSPGFEQMTMGIVPKMNEVLAHSQQQWQDLTRGNPYEKFYDALHEPMKRAWQSDIERIVEQRMEAQQTASNAERFEQDNAQWLYAQDQNTGQRVMTEQGQQFYEAINYFKERGVTDPQSLLECATRTVRGAQQTQPPASATPTPQAPVPQPTTTPAPADGTTPQSTFIQNALDRARHQPNAGGFTQQAPDNPVNVGENELNNMFISSFEASQA